MGEPKLYNPNDPEPPWELEELIDMLIDHPEALPEMLKVGYTALAAADGTMGHRKWDKSTVDSKGRLRHPTLTTAMPEHLKPIADPVKRTYMKRVESLTTKLITQYRESGSLGLSEDIVNEIVAESWHAGDALTGEQVKSIAMHYLNKSERTQPDKQKPKKVKQLDARLREGASVEL